MHRITYPDGTQKSSPALRFLRTLAYVLMATAGALLVASPHVTDVYGKLGGVLAWFLVLGGALSAFGSWTNRWFGEFTGLPLVAPAFATFGALVWRDNGDHAPLMAAANVCILVAIATVMLARWRMVLAIVRIAERHAPGRSREDQ